MQRSEPSNNQAAKTAAVLFFICILIADGIVAFFLVRERVGLYFPRKPVVFLPFVVKGNQGGEPTVVPAASATPTPVPTIAAIREPKKYTVQSGDTLWQIAQENGVTVDDLVNANKLADRDVIQVGQQLVIPAPASTATPKP